jgi:hypothetical protein
MTKRGIFARTLDDHDSAGEVEQQLVDDYVAPLAEFTRLRMASTTTAPRVWEARALFASIRSSPKNPLISARRRRRSRWGCQ